MIFYFCLSVSINFLFKKIFQIYRKLKYIRQLRDGDFQKNFDIQLYIRDEGDIEKEVYKYKNFVVSELIQKRFECFDY